MPPSTIRRRAGLFWMRGRRTPIWKALSRIHMRGKSLQLCGGEYGTLFSSVHQQGLDSHTYCISATKSLPPWPAKCVKMKAHPVAKKVQCDAWETTTFSSPWYKVLPHSARSSLRSSSDSAARTALTSLVRGGGPLAHTAISRSAVLSGWSAQKSFTREGDGGGLSTAVNCRWSATCSTGGLLRYISRKTSHPRTCRFNMSSRTLCMLLVVRRWKNMSVIALM